MRALRFFVDKNMVMAAFRKSLLKVSGNAVYNASFGIILFSIYEKKLVKTT